MRLIEVSFFVFICFFTLLVLSDSRRIYDDCRCRCPPPCTNISTSDSIINLYNLYNLPPLVQKYRDAVLSLINDNCVPESLKSVLTIQSLYIMDCVSGFNPGVSISCLLIDYIHAAANRQMDERAFQIASKKFYDFTFTVAANSIRLGLTSVGCPAPPPSISQTTTFPKCNIDCCVFQYLKNNVHLPANIKCIIRDMLNSCNEVERNAGLIAIAAASCENAALWNQLLNYGPELLNALKLKSCSGTIPPHCCCERHEQLTKSIDVLFDVMRKLLYPKSITRCYAVATA